MRIRNSSTDQVSKPMQMLGPQPLLWHIIKYYAQYGHKGIVLCLDLYSPHPRVIAVIGAHCDDIVIGLGGTLLSLSMKAAGPLAVHALILGGGASPREDEERQALAALCPGAVLEVTVLNVPDGRAPGQGEATEHSLELFRQTCEPDIVFAPQRYDAPQDHRLLAELIPTVLRDHRVLNYEILRWESDMSRPTIYDPLRPEVVQEKVRILLSHYPSQRDRDWFDEDAFLALARVRGVQCRNRYPEGFALEKATLDFGTA